MQAKGMLRKGYEAYLAHVIDTKRGPPKSEDIAMVNKFPDMFPEPDREMEKLQ